MKRKFIIVTIMAIVCFSCKKQDSGPEATTPVVTTAALTNVNPADSSATAGGTIVSDGGASVTKAGIVWSKTNAMPTITDSVVASTVTSGSFTVTIKGIAPNTAYYFRAFATNSVGTSYGQVVIPNNVDTSKVRFSYNGQQVEYGVIISPTTGRKWLDRNLGAKRQATAKDDYQAYGDQFQWGRPADGHQLMNWTNSTTGVRINGTTATLATTDIPGHNNFITNYDPNVGSSGDWRSDNNSNRWVTAPQGPCPAGWHVPTADEWRAELKYTGSPIQGTATSGGIIGDNTAYGLLKLTVAGTTKSDGQTEGDKPASQPGGKGTCWSSSDVIRDFGNSIYYTWGKCFTFGTDIFQVDDSPKAGGASVRCIHDL